MTQTPSPLDVAFSAGYAAFTLGRKPTSYPKCYTQAEITEWYSGYDRASEDTALDGNLELMSDNRAKW